MVTCSKQVKVHLLRHMDNDLYNCTICGKSLSWADYIKTHICRPWVMIPTTAVSVERASAGRITRKLIFAAHGWWPIQVHYLWKELQLGGQHQNSYSPLRARRQAELENTHFAFRNFSRTGGGYTASSDIYICIYICWRVSCDMWHVICDKWHVTHDTRPVWDIVSIFGYWYLYGYGCG